MKLHNLIKVGTNRLTKRRGRGQGSGCGGTSGRGHKGGKARSGYSPAPCCSGIPYYRRLPKRGFGNSMFAVRFAGINLDVLEALSANYGEINRDILVENGIIKPKETLIKILGDGKLTRAIRVVANKFSKNARQKIEAEGGVAIEVASKG